MKEFAKWLFLKIAPARLEAAAKRRHYLKSLRAFNYLEEPDLLVASMLVSPGDSVVDIGANIGWYTKVFSERVGASGNVYSIEPIPPTFELLKYCVEGLNLTNVTLFNLALSKDKGVGVMEVPHYDNDAGDNFYMARLIDNDANASNLSSYEVQISSLDDLVKDESISNISFVKCDVEGYELPVLRGAENTASKLKPAWLVEISSDPEDDKSEASNIFKYLKSLDYKAYWYNPTNEVLMPYKAGVSSVNYFFLLKNHFDILKNHNLKIEGL